MKLIEGGVCAAKGFTAGGVHCGIRKSRTKRDLALIVSEVKASAAAELVERVDERVKSQTSFIKNLTSDTESLLSQL